MTARPERPTFGQKLHWRLKRKEGHPLVETLAAVSVLGMVLIAGYQKMNDEPERSVPEAVPYSDQGTPTGRKAFPPLQEDMNQVAVFGYKGCGLTGANVRMADNGRRVLEMTTELTLDPTAEVILGTYPNGKFTLDPPEAKVEMISQDSMGTVFTPLDSQYYIGGLEGTMSVSVTLPVNMPPKSGVSFSVGSFVHNNAGTAVAGEKYCFSLFGVEKGDSVAWVTNSPNPVYDPPTLPPVIAGRPPEA